MQNIKRWDLTTYTLASTLTKDTSVSGLTTWQLDQNSTKRPPTSVAQDRAVILLSNLNHRPGDDRAGETSSEQVFRALAVSSKSIHCDYLTSVLIDSVAYRFGVSRLTTLILVANRGRRTLDRGPHQIIDQLLLDILDNHPLRAELQRFRLDSLEVFFLTAVR